MSERTIEEKLLDFGGWTMGGYLRELARRPFGVALANLALDGRLYSWSEAELREIVRHLLDFTGE